MVYSFDVFDTCLTRATATPSGVFRHAAQKLLARLGLPADPSTLDDLVAARIEAERIARLRTEREDITLSDIWHILIPSMGWEMDETLAGCELEAEDEMLTPICSIRDEVETRRKQGHRIVFVSDMYLPAGFIRRQLRKHGFAESTDGMYVSSEVGTTKFSGNLFRHMMDRENVDPSDVVHMGDHPQSDFAVPLRLGMRASLVETARLTETELAVLKMEGDLDRAARIAGVMRAGRVSAKTGESGPVHELASQFAGPFSIGFATWLLQRAQQDGIKRLYFSARDCQLLSKVANELSPLFGGIECRYLYVSRQSLFLPSAATISPEGMPWMRRDWEEPILRRLLAKLDLDFDSVEPQFAELVADQGDSYRLKTDADWTFFWTALNTEPLKKRVLDHIAGRRAATQDYLKSAGLYDDVKWAVVDLGWTLTCQQALWRLLKQSGWKGTIKGYYLGLARQRVNRSEAGNSEAMFYQPALDVPPGTKVDAFFARSTLLEHIIGCADHPTVHHHERQPDGSVTPVFNGKMDEVALKFCQHLHASTLEFARQNKLLVESFKDVASCQSALTSLASGFFSTPSEQSARALLGLSATSDQNGLNSGLIVEPFNWGSTVSTLLRTGRAHEESRRQENGFWREGSLAITPPKVKRSLALAQKAARRIKGR